MVFPVAYFRSCVPGDGIQSAAAHHLFVHSDAGSFRHPPRAALHRQLPDRTRGTHRGTGFGAVH